MGIIVTTSNGLFTNSTWRCINDTGAELPPISEWPKAKEVNSNTQMQEWESGPGKHSKGKWIWSQEELGSVACAPDEGLNHNYCRKPDIDDTETKVWCYTSDPDKRWEFCEVPFCFEPPKQRKKKTSISVSPKKTRASCLVSASSSACNDCVKEGCKVGRSPGCCLHPTCRKKRRRKCKWIQRYLGSFFFFI